MLIQHIFESIKRHNFQRLPGHTILQVDISFRCTKSSYSQTYPQNQRHLLNSPTPSPLPIPLILISDWWVTNVNTFWPLNNRIRTKGIKNEIDWLINQSVWDDEIPKEDIPVAFPGAAATDDWLVWLGARPQHQPLILPLKLTFIPPWCINKPARFLLPPRNWAIGIGIGRLVIGSYQWPNSASDQRRSSRTRSQIAVVNFGTDLRF